MKIMPHTEFPKIVTLGSLQALSQPKIIRYIIHLTDTPTPRVLYLSTNKQCCELIDTPECKTCITEYLQKKCDVKCHNLNYSSVQEDLDSLLTWADVVICNWNQEHNKHWQLRYALFSANKFVLCAEVQVAKALLDNKSITRLTKWRYCPDDTDIASSDEARLILSHDKCKRVIGVDKLAAHVIINEESMAISGNKHDKCHIFFRDEITNEIISTPLPTSWDEPIPTEELVEFHEPATNPHLEILEELVDTNFVIADDVIPEVSHHRRTNSESTHSRALSEVSVEDMFPKIVAAGKPGALQLGPIFDKVIELSGKELPNLLFIGTASFDRTDRFNSNTKRFREIGCDVRRLDVSDEDSNPCTEEMQFLVVDWANVIMCAGGNTLHALLRWKEVGLDMLIKESSMKGTVLCGGSAGAGCWFSSLHTDSLRPDNTKNKEQVLSDMDDEDLADWAYTKISALGFIDAMCVPHFDVTGTNGVARSEDAEQMLQADPSTPAIGVDENAAFVVVGDEALSVSGDGIATCHVVHRDEETGEVTSTPISVQESMNLEEVLESGHNSEDERSVMEVIHEHEENYK